MIPKVLIKTNHSRLFFKHSKWHINEGTIYIISSWDIWYLFTVMQKFNFLVTVHKNLFIFRWIYIIQAPYSYFSRPYWSQICKRSIKCCNLPLVVYWPILSHQLDHDNAERQLHWFPKDLRVVKHESNLLRIDTSGTGEMKVSGCWFEIAEESHKTVSVKMFWNPQIKCFLKNSIVKLKNFW